MPPHAARRAYHLQQPHGHVAVSIYARAAAANVVASISGLPELGTVEQLLISGEEVAGAGLQNSIHFRTTPLDGSALAAPPNLDRIPWEWKQDNAAQLGQWLSSWMQLRHLKQYMSVYGADWRGVFTFYQEAQANQGRTAWCVMGTEPNDTATPPTGGPEAGSPATSPPPAPPDSGAQHGKGQGPPQVPPGQAKKNP